MMKAILEFDLPEDKDAYALATHGNDYWRCLWELDQQLRGYLKHGTGGFSTPEEVMEFVRDYIHTNVDLDEIE